MSKPAKLPKNLNTIQFGIADRADQLLMLANESADPQRTRLRRLALELERLRCQVHDALKEKPTGSTWHWCYVSEERIGRAGDRIDPYQELLSELEGDRLGRAAWGQLRVIEGGLS